MNRIALHIGTLLFAAAALLACTEERPAGEPEPEQPTNPTKPRTVGLSVDGGALTRRASLSFPDEIRSMGIIGYSTGKEDFDASDASLHEPNLFYNLEATRAVITEAVPADGDDPRVPAVLDAWVYDPVAIWPTDDEEKNTFFAYAPFHEYDFGDEWGGAINIILKNETSGPPQIEYTVPEIVGEQVDLLYSEYNADVRNINYEYTKQNGYTPGHVKYKMKHALLWLRFIIAPVKETITEETPTGNANERYFITEFYLNAGSIINTCVFDIASGTWDVANATPEPVFYDFEFLSTGAAEFKAGVTAPLTARDECMMIIPQSFVYTTNLMTLNVSYHHDADGAYDPDDPDPDDDTEYYATVPFPDVKLTSAGTVMTYIVKISTSGVRIDFDSMNTIEEWLKDEGYYEVEVF